MLLMEVMIGGPEFQPDNAVQNVEKTKAQVRF
jgi:hypothetical protein